jgi:XapX domain-containing protein
MKIYVVSVSAGLLIGAIYGLLGVRSPAPPVVALVGLLGMLLGEQGFTLGARLVKGQAVTRAWFAAECVTKITGAGGSPSSPSPGAGSAVSPPAGAAHGETSRK